MSLSKLFMVCSIAMGMLCCLLPAAAEQKSPAPIILFNGRNLDGWIFDVVDPAVKLEDVWSVQHGILVCNGRPPAFIRTEKEFENYEVVVEWRWPEGGNPGNSGLLVHASTPRQLFVWPKSIEVQLAHENAGDFWMIGESIKVPGANPQGRRWLKRQASVEKPAGEWNTLRVRCEDDRITVRVNGVLMNEGREASATKGALGLQSEGAPIHFRKVELTPLP